MSGKLSRAELKRLEDLKLKLDLQQKKLATQKKQIAKEKKGLDAEKKKISQGWKELDRAKKKFADEREVAAKQSLSSNMKSSRSASGSNKKFQDQFFEMKKRHDQESKKAREYKKKLDQLEAENRVLRNKIKNLSGKRRGKGDDKRLRQLIRENRELRKRLRKMMKELNKRRRWYNRAIKIFKNNQNKWVKAQRSALKNKGLIIKYVFLDDVKYIKQYQKPRKGRERIKFRNRVRVKTKGGGETTLKNVEIQVLDAEEGDSDSDDDAGADKDGKRKKKRKKKKGDGADGDEEAKDEDEDGDSKSGKKKKRKKKAAGGEAEAEEEMEQYLDELMAEFGIANDEIAEDEEDLPSEVEDEEEDEDDDDDDLDDADDADDADGDDLDDEDGAGSAGGGDEALSAQMVYMRQEMDERAHDLEKLRAVLGASESPQEEMAALLDGVDERQQAMVENLKKLDSNDVQPVEEGNAEWRQYLLSLSKAIAGNAEQMAQVLGLVQTGFLKELEGRRRDLGHINNVYYDEERDAEQADLESLKQGVDERHGEISQEVQASQEQLAAQESERKQDEDENADDEEARESEAESNQSKIKALLEGLLATNSSWNELIATSSTMHGESQTAKNGLVEKLLEKYAQMQEWTAKVEQMPATKLL